MKLPSPQPGFNVWTLTLLILMGVNARVAGDDGIRIRRIQSPSPGQFPSAVRIANSPLVHTTQMLPPAGSAGDSQSQCLGLLRELDGLLAEYQSKRADLVKLNVYVRSPAVREIFLQELAKWSAGDLPAVACVATPLPDPKADVALDAIFASRRMKTEAVPSRDLIEKTDTGQWARASILPLGDVVYISGQAQPGELAVATRSTLDELHRTLKHLDLEKRHIVQVKCFLQPMDQAAAVNRRIAEFFGEEALPPVSHVEWVSGSLPIEIEIVAWAPAVESAETVTYHTPPWMKSSPVFSRVARIHGNDRIYISGLYASQKGTGEAEVRSVFEEIGRILKEAESDMKHLAKATYYVADDEGSQELNRLRPEYYDPRRPPAASKAAVANVGRSDRRLTLDLIAAPISGAGKPQR